MLGKINILLSICLLFGFNALGADTLTVHSEIKQVTVFLKGAQVKRNASCLLQKGENLINFTKITSHADEKSVQVKSGEAVAIQSVSYSINYTDSLERKSKIKALQKELDSLAQLLLVFENKLYVLQQEQELLSENQVLSGEKRIIDTEELKRASDYYRKQMSEIVLLKKKTKDGKENIIKRQQQINNQLKELNSKKEKPVGEVWVIVYAKEAGIQEFNIEYYVANAGWRPKYDIRTESVVKPAILSYKADVFQNTDDDWSNVELILSSSNPALGGTKPELKSWKLDVNKNYEYYSNYSSNSSYNNSVAYYNDIRKDNKKPVDVKAGMITGTVIGADDMQPLPGVNIWIKGTDRGTITDLDGRYSIDNTGDIEYLVFSFVGFLSSEKAITGSVVDCTLELDATGIDEVVVIGYGTQKRSDVVGAISSISVDAYGNFVPQGPASGSFSSYSSSGNFKLRLPKIFKRKKKLINKKLVGLNKIKENATSVQFVLDKPYTIPTDNKNYSVDIEKYEIPVNYQYSTVPKMEESAFLLAELTGWEQLNLLSGNVNIYFEGAFVGQSQLDLKQTSDTLNFSMGRDKAIVIDRKLKKDFTKKQLLSKWKVEEYNWEITVKNTKNEKVNLNIEDQIPVSYSKNIEVELLESSDAKYDTNKGELKWDMELKPLEKKILTMSYRVKTKRT